MMKTAKEIREMLREAIASGKNLYCHWNSESFRVINASTVRGVVWVRAINHRSYMVTTAHTFDIR